MPQKQNRKKNFSITISENIIQKFNNKIGYGSRSKAIEELILQDLKKSLAREIEPTKGKKKDRVEKGGLDNI